FVNPDGVFGNQLEISTIAPAGLASRVALVQHDDPQASRLDRFRQVVGSRCSGQARTDDDDIGGIRQLWPRLIVRKRVARAQPVRLSVDGQANRPCRDDTQPAEELLEKSCRGSAEPAVCFQRTQLVTEVGVWTAQRVAGAVESSLR